MISLWGRVSSFLLSVSGYGNSRNQSDRETGDIFDKGKQVLHCGSMKGMRTRTDADAR